MTLSRRGFLAATGAALALRPGLATAGASTHLRAAPSEAQIAPPEYPATRVWAYNDSIPGPELRHRQGELFAARFENGLTQDSSIHWHGLRLPVAMDGVPGFSHPAVQPGGAFDYRFRLRDAGTFWYHPHASSLEQVSRGLSGVLVVEEPQTPDVDADVTLVLDDWRMTQEAQIHESFGNFHDLSHAGRLGNYVTVNGRDDWSQPARQGDRLRLRLVNTATGRIFRLRPMGMTLWVMALDGMPLDVPRVMDEVVLGPAQRIDVFADMRGPEEALLASVERDQSFVVASFPLSGGTGTVREAPTALPPNDLPALDLVGAQQVPLVMEGGAMRGLPSARHKGAEMDMRALAQEGQFWAFNGEAGMPATPLAQVSVGETLRVRIENRTAFPHAQHLHGHHFRGVQEDGTLGPWRDTILVNPNETREIAFTAEEHGDWMFHCHMLSHQMAGMMTFIRVV